MDVLSVDAKCLLILIWIDERNRAQAWWEEYKDYPCTSLWSRVALSIIPDIWLEAPVYDVHNVSIIVLSKVKIVRPYGMSSYWIDYFGT